MTNIVWHCSFDPPMQNTIITMINFASAARFVVLSHIKHYSYRCNIAIKTIVNLSLVIVNGTDTLVDSLWTLLTLVICDL
jgi:hypothetical protein